MAGAAGCGGPARDSSSAPTTAAAGPGLDLDQLLARVGEFGRYQQLLLWLVCLPACLPCGFGAFSQLFVAGSPAHWCRAPELAAAGVPAAVRRRLAPQAGGAGSQCERYAVNWTELLPELLPEPGCGWEALQLPPNTSWPTEPCADGWDYDTAEVASSIVIDFDLVCSRTIFPTLGLVALNAGGPVGVYLFGLLNDRFGRRASFFTCLSVFLAGSALSAAAPNFWSWAACRMLVGLTIPALYQIPFIIALELVGPSYRTFVTVMTCLSYTVGLMVLSGLAYLIRDWVLFTLVTSLPFVLFYFYWWFLPESPRWLLARGRLREAAVVLERLATANRVQLPASFQAELKRQMMLQRSRSEEQRLNKTPGMCMLCQTPNMRLKTTLITFNWFANNMAYVGLSYYGPALGSDQYLSFLLSAAAELPGCLACWLLMDCWGRRWPLCLSMVAGGACCAATALLPDGSIVSTMVLYLIAKCAISASFLIIYPFAGELYPTALRGVGIGTSAYISGLGLMLVPFVTYLGAEELTLPLVVLGAVAAVGGLASLRLPETLHRRLPQTLQEGEQFGSDWSARDCLRCIPPRSPSPCSSSGEEAEAEPLEMAVLAPAPARPRPPRLQRQASVLEMPRDADGAVIITYWF